MSVTTCEKCDHVQYNPDEEERIVQVIANSNGHIECGLSNHGRLFTVMYTSTGTGWVLLNNFKSGVFATLGELEAG